MKVFDARSINATTAVAITEIRRNFCTFVQSLNYRQPPPPPTILNIAAINGRIHRTKSNLSRSHTPADKYSSRVNERQTLTCRILLLGKIERAGYATNEQTSLRLRCQNRWPCPPCWTANNASTDEPRNLCLPYVYRVQHPACVPSVNPIVLQIRPSTRTAPDCSLLFQLILLSFPRYLHDRD